MTSVGFVVHHERPRAVELAREAVDWLKGEGHEPRVLQPDADAIGLSEWGVPTEDFANGLAVAVSLGGDGTMLRTVHLVAGAGVPVLGVNLGRLAYLSPIEPGALKDALARFIAGDYLIECRMTLEVDVDARSGVVASGPRCALNEVVMDKPSSGHTVRIAVHINGRFFTSYAADGLIVATPTGSTAYALSARGPIISPLHRAILMTPVAPHMLFDRSLVLDPAESIRLEVVDDRKATLTIDGQELGTLQGGDSITCRAGTTDAQLVTIEQRDFHRLLKTKFGLADR